ncbi:hypothetical protein N431DRAFT_487398 [Stipitochalara longipes BDJ]|nr:hypothetical protein N431DRAFT_487398 [Stipitochalara longipes BDJ]
MATEVKALSDGHATERNDNSTSETSKDSKRKRRGGPKVKSGCLTCKVRRVKCDERKPICKRCVRFGVQCDGYATKPVIKTAVHMGPRPLVPKDVVQANHLCAQPYAGPDFSCEEEARYFRFYCENVAAQLSGPLETTLWDRIIPQAVETEPLIKHAVVAVAALNKSRIDAAKGMGKSNSHHQFALLQYGKALKRIRDTLTDGIKDPRRSLMACMLVFCLECLQGYQNSASNQASIGVALLQRWCIDGQSLSHVKKVEDDICYGLSSLDLQALLFLDTRSVSIHRDLLKFAAEKMECRPMVMESLKDCYLYWQLVMRHCYHWIAVARSEVSQENSIASSQSTSSGHPPSFEPGNNPWSTFLAASKETPVNVQKELDACIENIHRWERASKELIGEALNSRKDTDEYIIAAMVKIHVAMTHVALGTAFSQDEMEYDDFTSEFDTITTFSEDIHPALVARDRGSRFHYNLGILPGLCQVGMWCRQKAIRGRAISLLMKSPEMQEGVWNSESLGRFVHFLRTVEEDDADPDEVVPASKRVSWIGCSVSMYEKIAQVRCVRRDGDFEDSVEMSDFITWWGDGFNVK